MGGSGPGRASGRGSALYCSYAVVVVVALLLGPGVGSSVGGGGVYVVVRVDRGLARSRLGTVLASAVEGGD